MIMLLGTSMGGKTGSREIKAYGSFCRRSVSFTIRFGKDMAAHPFIYSKLFQEACRLVACDKDFLDSHACLKMIEQDRKAEARCGRAGQL